MRTVLALILLCTSAVFAADEPKVEAVLSQTRSMNGILPQLMLTLTNKCEKPITLVVPGDGSEAGWRTPIIEYTWLREGKGVPRIGIGRCGNMNSLREGEVFTLQPGESKAMTEWIYAHPPAPGKYELKVRYTNKPDAEWKGLAGPHNATEMEKVKNSTALTVESNALEVNVPEAK